MSTSSYSYSNSNCFCGPFTTNPCSYLGYHSNQKQMTLRQVISYKKELHSDQKINTDTRNKISLSFLKKSRQISQNVNNSFSNSSNIQYKKSSSNIAVITQNSNQYTQQKDIRPRLNHNNRNIQQTKRFYDVPQQSLLRNKIIKTDISKKENNGLQFSNRSYKMVQKIVTLQELQKLNLHNYAEKYRVVVQNPTKQHLVPKIQFTRIHPITLMNNYNEPQRIMKSAQQTISTNSSQQMIFIKQAESVDGQSQDIMSPISDQYKGFPKCFRKAQSLQDDESQMGEPSIVLDHYQLNGKIKEAQTDRIIQIRDMDEIKSKKQYESEKRSKKQDSYFKEI